MSNLAAAVFNRKGGVGKTTLAVILAELALIHRKRVLMIDLDPSGNFTSAFNFLKDSSFKDNFRMKNTLEDSDAECEEDFTVIDCPPVLDDTTKHAMDFADIMLIPVRPDYFALSPLRLLTAIAEKDYGKSRAQLPIVKMGFDTSSIAKVANQIIQDNAYPVAEDLPFHKSIPYNISSGKIWSIGLTARSRQPYERLYTKLWHAVDRLTEDPDNIYEVWASDWEA